MSLPNTREIDDAQQAVIEAARSLREVQTEGKMGSAPAEEKLDQRLLELAAAVFSRDAMNLVSIAIEASISRENLIDIVTITYDKMVADTITYDKMVDDRQ